MVPPMRMSWRILSFSLMCLLAVACQKNQKNQKKKTGGKATERSGMSMGGDSVMQVGGDSMAAVKKMTTNADAWAVVFFTLVHQKKYDEAEGKLGAELKKVLDAKKLQLMWEQMIVQLGAYKGIRIKKRTVIKGSSRLELLLKFEKMAIKTIVAFNPQGEMIGFFLQPPKRKFPPWKAPAYVKKDTFTEEKVTVGKGELALPGVVTLPKRPKGKLPAVVLVHGSGPQDRDETLGPTKAFKDLAWGLASRGIVVLRYDKVSKAHPRKSAAKWATTVTMDHETTDDALRAAALLRKHPRVDPRRVVYCGHSQGALAAPRAGKRDPKLAGLILLASPTRDLLDVTIAQYEYIATLGGAPAKAMAKMLPGIRAGAKLVRSKALKPDTDPRKLPMGLPASWWLDLRGYKPAEMAKALKMPIFVLQGEADYQVTMEDFAGWKKGLKGKKNVSFKSYPRLGHTFIDLKKKKAKPMDYFVAGNVSLEVVEDLAKWIKALK